MMNSLDYLKKTRQNGKRYFTLEQFMLDRKLSQNAALNAIHRLKTHGDLISPVRGLYVIVPPENQSQGSIPAEDLLPILMNYLKADYYVSLLSAAQYHGAAHQKAGCFQFISNKRIKHRLEFGQIKLELIYKKCLADLPIQDITVRTGYLKIATPELVILDLLTYISKSGGLNHIATILSELIEVVNANKLIQLAEKSKKHAWVQRLGYILEHIDSMDGEKLKNIVNILDAYLRKKKKAFIPLAPELSKKGCSREKKWMIIENTTIESDL
ncbi:MAG TPA: type IV toxin-antitoxin system AbiEi family antitoxin [Chthoniobacterales bacterium]|nr:type IV toxin-antitoxin system AbiEi family antitoxin [Chthoniobacterales bacterium]